MSSGSPSRNMQAGRSMPLSADILLAEYEDIVDQAVLRLLAADANRLPDLSGLCIITPHQNLSGYCRSRLLNRLPAGQTAVMPPYIGTLRQWVSDTITLPGEDVSVLSEQARRLLLVEALSEHPGHFKQENKWQVGGALLRLFDELTLNQVDALDQSRDQWQQTLATAYACGSANAHLQQEAELVQDLWRAWQQQLLARDQLDGSAAYLARLRQAQTLDALPYFYLIAPERLAPCEQHFMASIAARGRCTTLDYGRNADASARHAQAATAVFVERAFDHQAAPLKQRAADFSVTDDRALPFSIFYSGDAETEARAVDLQVRLWLLEGKRNIGIVSEDRRLSRRVRALLERADVHLQDLAGWSLSTTSAAAVLERWLQCIEEDFDYRPMLDLLKSHFFRSGLKAEAQLETVYRVENDIILHENIGHGIRRYRKQLEYRLHRLEHWPADTYGNCVQLLDQLDKAAQHLQQLYHSDSAFSLERYLEALETSLQRLGILDAFAEDAAGIQVLDALADMRDALHLASVQLDWSDFRLWLGITLEQQLFTPQTAPSPVRLMSLAQAEFQRFDAMIIAAADRQHLPGKPETSPFFNQAVRLSLGLPDWQQQIATRQEQFKRLLQAAPEILITCKHEENGEPVPLSPWIEALATFHKLTHAGSLEHTNLRRLLEQDTAVFICDTDALPGIPRQPAPSLPAAAIPERMSASAHQRLIDCPYKYFAGDGMNLKAPDEIREELQKSDYGERVHLILNAFHNAVRRLPAPFAGPLDAENRDRAIRHMASLSETVFRQDMEDNALHRSWLHRWMQHVPAYIDWQIRQQREWSVSETEQRREVPLEAIDLKLYGRLDRIDRHLHEPGHRAIIDYKTGASPSQDDVDSGEDVQLASYALLAEDAWSVSYLALDENNGAVRTRASLEGDALRALTQSVRERLETVIRMQRAGSRMPAWGDEQSCSRCDFVGLCRRKVWSKTQ